MMKSSGRKIAGWGLSLAFGKYCFPVGLERGFSFAVYYEKFQTYIV